MQKICREPGVEDNTIQTDQQDTDIEGAGGGIEGNIEEASIADSGASLFYKHNEIAPSEESSVNTDDHDINVEAIKDKEKFNKWLHC